MRNFVDIKKCDVEDIESLAHFRKLAQIWDSSIFSEDRNSIQNQLSSMLNDFGRFKLFVYALTKSQPKFDTEEGYENSIVELFIRCFFDSHLLAIRRISDNVDFNPDRAVISLPTLLNSVLENLPYMTRENYVCYDGTPYAESGEMLGTVIQRIRGRHWQFDVLCGSSVRARKDHLDKKIVRKLITKIELLKKVRDYTNKFLAHASDPKNRKQDPGYYTIMMDEMEKNIEVVCEIAHGLGKVCGCMLHSLIANPGIETLDGWTDQLLGKDLVTNAYEHWKELTAEADLRSREKNEAEHFNWS